MTFTGTLPLTSTVKPKRIQLLMRKIEHFKAEFKRSDSEKHSTKIDHSQFNLESIFWGNTWLIKISMIGCSVE